MRQIVQNVLTLVMCLALVAGSVVGCAEFGDTVRRQGGTWAPAVTVAVALAGPCCAPAGVSPAGKRQTAAHQPEPTGDQCGTRR